MTKATEFSREGALTKLIERDGLVCRFPGCDREEFDVEGDFSLTIDHWMPQSYGRANGWTHEQIWDISNLRILHRKCNALKGDRIPNEDGTLPPRPIDLRPSHQRRADRSGRVDVCETCMSGRLLLEGEECYDCGSGPQPSTMPKYLQVTPKECSHGWGENPELHCWLCFVGHVERRPAMEDVLDADHLEE